MPRTLPTGVQAAVSTSGYRACLAVAIGTATPIWVTDNPAGVTIGGNVYPAGFLSVSETRYDDQPAVSVRISNTGNQITVPDLDGTAGGGVIGKTLVLYEVTYSAAGAQLTEDVLYSGIVAGFVADADTAEVVGTLAELCTAGMVGLITSRLCPYVYGGARCGDNDATSCDHTFTGCTAHANTARFGGFRTMPTLNTRLQYYLTEWVPGSSRFGVAVSASDPIPTATIRSPRKKINSKLVISSKDIVDVGEGGIPVLPPPTWKK
jgi:hypothetical protein